MITFIDAENTFDTIQHLFMILKNSQQTRISSEHSELKGYK